MRLKPQRKNSKKLETTLIVQLRTLGIERSRDPMPTPKLQANR